MNVEHRKNTSTNLDAYKDDWLEKIEQHEQQFQTAMDDDFNTANAITVLFDLAKEANVYLNENHTEVDIIEKFQAQMEKFLNVLGITLEVEVELLDEEIEALIAERDEARKSRNFERADEIRDQLKEQ